MTANAPHMFDLDGESRKRLAHKLLEAHRARLIRSGRRTLLLHLLHHGSGTDDGVRTAVPVPDGIDPKLFGAVPGPLAAAEIIEPVGYVRTVRPVGHARPIVRWRLLDPAAATSWLASHAELADPELGVVDG